MLVTPLQRLGALQALADGRVLVQERLAVTVQPVNHLQGRHKLTVRSSGTADS